MSRIYLRLAFLARRSPGILWSDAVACSAVSNGPEYLPLLKSSMLSRNATCTRLSMSVFGVMTTLPLLFLDLEVVAGFEPETAVQFLGDHDLAAHAQLDDSRCFGVWFSEICILQLARASVKVRSVATMLPRLGSIRGDSRGREGTTARLERDDRQRVIARSPLPSGT